MGTLERITEAVKEEGGAEGTRIKWANKVFVTIIIKKNKLGKH